MGGGCYLDGGNSTFVDVMVEGNMAIEVSRTDNFAKLWSNASLYSHLPLYLFFISLFISSEEGSTCEIMIAL